MTWGSVGGSPQDPRRMERIDKNKNKNGVGRLRSSLIHGGGLAWAAD